MADEWVLPREMVMVGLSSEAGAGDLTFDRTQRRLDTTEYDGSPTYYVEVLATNTDSSDRKVYVENRDGTTYANAEVTVPNGTSNVTRIRSSVAWTPTAGEEWYRVKIDDTTNANELKVYRCRIIIVQSNPTKTVLEYVMMAGDSKTPTSDTASAASALYSSNGSTYKTYNNGVSPLWLKDNTTYFGASTVDNWILEQVILATNGFVRLYNETDSTAVANSAFSHTSAVNPGGAANTFSDSETGFDDLDEYRVQWRSNSPLDQLNTFSMVLSVALSDLADSEVWWSLVQGDSVSGAGADQTENQVQARCKIDNTGGYFQISGFEESGTTGECRLIVDSTNDSGTGGTEEETLEFTTTNAVTRAGSATSILSGNRVYARMVDFSGGGTADTNFVSVILATTLLLPM
jgi:hypothetical protein